MNQQIIIPTIGLDNRGGTRIFIELANRLVQRDYRVKLLVPRNSNNTTFKIHPNVIVKSIGFPIMQIEDISSILRTMMLFLPLLRSCDVVIANYYLTSFPVFFSKLLSFPSLSINFIQGYEPIISGELERTFPRIKKKLVEISYRFPMEQVTVANWIAERVRNISKRQVYVIRPNIDLSVFKPQDGIPMSKTPTILAFPSNEIYKGWKDFSLAVKLLERTIPDLRVIAASRFPYQLPDGPYIGINPNNDKEIAGLYQSSDVYVHPSWWEACPLSPLEAMACGTPVVAAASEGIKEYAIDGGNCLIVPPRSPEILADAISNILGDNSLQYKLRNGGFETVRNFAWPKMVDEFENLIEELNTKL